MVNTSLKTSAQLQSLAPYYYPSPATLGNYAALLGTTNFPIWIRNSALVAVGGTLVTVLVSSLAGYSLTRIPYPGRRLLATAVLIVYLVPPTLLFLHDTELKTIPVGLNDLMFGDIFLWGELMAAAVLTTLPVIVLYTYLQRYMVEGLTAGAVKG